MAPTLRLAMTDRPVLRLGRKNALRHMEVDGQYLPSSPNQLPSSSDTLPSICRLDTRSFINLFEQFQNLESQHDDAKPLDIMEGSQSISLASSATQNSSLSPVLAQDALHSHGNTTAMASKPPKKVKRRLNPVARGDSTASSGSSMPTDNETFSHNSRRSSRSSFTPAAELSPAKPVSPRGWRAKKKFSVSHPNLLTAVDHQMAENKENISPEGSAGADKPLPPAPFFDIGSMFAAVGMEPEQHEKHKAAGRKIRPVTPVRPSTRHTKSASAGDCPTLSAIRNERPTTPATSRGARLGKAISHGTQRRRSDSSPPVRLDLASPVKPEIEKARLWKRNNINSTMASTHAADEVRLQIMRELDDLKDLQSTALISRRFYGTFKRHESALVSHVLRSECPPAWEMLQIVSSKQYAVSMQTYRDYKRTLEALRVTILMQCQTHLKEEAFAGLIGSDMMRRKRVDRALWRTWVFCERFGREDEKQRDVQAQVDWLNGGKLAQQTSENKSFGSGNGTGLSVEELEDISEIWHCLGLLLQGFQNRVDEAILAGILNQCTLDETCTEEWFSREWIYHLLCLGPSVVSSISSCSFEHANALGLTTWTAPTSQQQSRSTFLKAAVTAVYQERIVAEATLKAAQMSLPIRATQRLSKSETVLSAHARKLQGLPTIITSTGPVQQPASPVKRRPVARRPRISSAPLPGPSLQHSQSQASVPQRPSMAISPASNLIMYHSFAMTPTASTRLGATLFPVDNQNRRFSQIPILPSPQSQPQSAAVTPAPHPWDAPQDVVIDPVDKAMARLVNEMGFAPADAKRALASCDTGFGMDLDRAIEMLTAEAEGRAVGMNNRTVSGGYINNGTVSRRGGENTLCENCGCTSPKQRRHHKQQQEHDAATIEDTLRPTNLEREAADSLGQLFLQSCSPTNPRALTHRTSNTKAYKILGVDVNRSGSGGGSKKAKAGRFGSMRLKPSTQVSGQSQFVKSLSRGVGTVKMPRVSLGMGVTMNMNLATLGLGAGRV